MSTMKRKRCFNSEGDGGDSGAGDQLLVKKKRPDIVESDSEDNSDDETLRQSDSLPPRSSLSLEESDSQVFEQERPNKYCTLSELISRPKYKTNFQEHKQEMTRRLYKFYNRTVFDNQLPEYMSIKWNKRLTKTCGRTSFHELNVDRYAFIQLSDKVCDSAERLRDTLIHEMCHAACWILDGKHDDHHGWLWQWYCQEATLAHHDLPPITQYHTYHINYSVVYGCTGCNNRVGRWTESMDTEKSACPVCKNKMVLLRKT